MKIYLDTNVFLDMIVPRDNSQDLIQARYLRHFGDLGKGIRSPK